MPLAIAPAGVLGIGAVNELDGTALETVRREHGTAVVALTIDEEGQARTAEWKVAVADRLIADLVGNWGMQIGDIIVDCLTFPVTTGQEETRRDALETIKAIKQVTTKYPGIHTTLGISNVSFGLNPAARQVLNSVFLHECVEAGLDSGPVYLRLDLPLMGGEYADELEDALGKLGAEVACEALVTLAYSIFEPAGP